MRPDYEILRVRPEKNTAPLTEQLYYEVRRENKLEALSRLIDLEEEIYAMVFCKTKTDVDELAEALAGRGFSVAALHGDLAQTQRTKVINSFKARKFRILIATDVAARGIDVNDLTHVINYSIPQSAEAYIHRIGRTGGPVDAELPSRLSRRGRPAVSNGSAARPARRSARPLCRRSINSLPQRNSALPHSFAL